MSLRAELDAPTFLIAVPNLRDPNFQTTVILLLEHHEREGSMGLILNRPSPLPIGAFCASQRMVFQGDITMLVHNGGPVQTDRAFILHSSNHQGPETTEVLPTVRLSYSLESLRLLAQSPPTYMRVFLGYAGWGPGQLAQEVSLGAWLITEPHQPLIFNLAHSEIWHQALTAVGIEAFRLCHSSAHN